MPFPTIVLAQRIGNGDADAVAATLLYGGTMVCTAAMFNVIWRYASSRGGHLLDPELAQAGRAAARGYGYGVPIYLLITLVAFVSPHREPGSSRPRRGRHEPTATARRLPRAVARPGVASGTRTRQPIHDQTQRELDSKQHDRFQGPFP